MHVHTRALQYFPLDYSLIICLLLPLCVLPQETLIVLVCCAHARVCVIYITIVVQVICSMYVRTYVLIICVFCTVCLYTHRYVCACMHTCTHAHTHIHTHTHTHIYKHASLLNVYTHTHNIYTLVLYIPFL